MSFLKLNWRHTIIVTVAAGRIVVRGDYLSAGRDLIRSCRHLNIDSTLSTGQVTENTPGTKVNYDAQRLNAIKQGFLLCLTLLPYKDSGELAELIQKHQPAVATDTHPCVT